MLRDHAHDENTADAGCTFAEVLLYDGAGRYGEIDENDPALVTLRESHGLVALRDKKTLLPGELCFPMSAGGKLVGALVVGRKALGESFAPDECDAIAHVAHGAGVALALLAASGETTLEKPSPSLEALVAAVEDLPRTIAAALERAVASRDFRALAAGDRSDECAPPR